MAELVGALLSCTLDQEVREHLPLYDYADMLVPKTDRRVESSVHAMQVSMIPSLWKFGCELLASLARWCVYSGVLLLAD